MARTLADLKAKPKQLPTRTVRICLDQEVVSDIQRLDMEKEDLQIERARLVVPRTDDGERQGPPSRTGGHPPRVAEIDARLAEIEDEYEPLFDRMRESEGHLLVRAVSGGEWQRFKDDNPPREGSKADEDNAYGLVDSSALLADLGRYVASWNGEAFGAGDWDWFSAQVAPADLSELCREVVQLHEARVRVPKARSTASSDTPPSATA